MVKRTSALTTYGKMKYTENETQHMIWKPMPPTEITLFILCFVYMVPNINLLLLLEPSGKAAEYS